MRARGVLVCWFMAVDEQMKRDGERDRVVTSQQTTEPMGTAV